MSTHRLGSQLSYAGGRAQTGRPAGSLYLYALACAYLGAPEGSEEEKTLEALVDERAALECVNGHAVLFVLAGLP